LNAETESEGSKLTIGYLGSANASNAHAIESFLSNVWPDLVANANIKVNLLIAGGICQWLVQSEDFESVDSTGIDLLGSIADLETFYNRVDVVINPVQFGTGLKIKNCEAISFGKPVLTTSSGNTGFAEAVKPATVICDTPSAFMNGLTLLAEDSNKLAQLKAAATELSQAGFSDQGVYSELKQTLQRAN